MLSDSQIEDIVAYLRSLSTTSVAAPAPTSAPVVTMVEYAQTNMTLTQSTNAQGVTVVNAHLQRNDGAPVVGAPLAFARATVLGEMDLGTIKTDNGGNATLFLDTVPETARIVNVNFKGDKNLGSSSGKIALMPPIVASSSDIPNLNSVRLSVGDEPLLPPEGSLITPNPPLVPTLMFGLVVLGVWSIYGYVVSQVVGIWKSKPNTRRENIISTKSR
jgi:hypothetical protein